MPSRPRCRWPPESLLGRRRNIGVSPSISAVAATSRRTVRRGSPAIRSGNPMFCSTVMNGYRVGSWKTMPSVSDSRGTCATGTPSISTDPDVISSRPATMRSTDVLPHPDGPTTTRNSPSSISRSMPRTTSSASNRLVSCRMLTFATVRSSLVGISTLAAAAAHVNEGPRPRPRSRSGRVETVFRPSRLRRGPRQDDFRMTGTIRPGGIPIRGDRERSSDGRA